MGGLVAAMVMMVAVGSDTPRLAADIPDALLGPYAALVGAILIIGWLGRLLTTFITDIRAQRDVALQGWREQTAATNAVAAAIEARNRAEESRLQIEQAEAAATARVAGRGRSAAAIKRAAGRADS